MAATGLPRATTVLRAAGRRGLPDHATIGEGVDELPRARHRNPRRGRRVGGGRDKRYIAGGLTVRMRGEIGGGRARAQCWPDHTYAYRRGGRRTQCFTAPAGASQGGRRRNEPAHGYRHLLRLSLTSSGVNGMPTTYRPGADRGSGLAEQGHRVAVSGTGGRGPGTPTGATCRNRGSASLTSTPISALSWPATQTGCTRPTR